MDFSLLSSWFSPTILPFIVAVLFTASTVIMCFFKKKKSDRGPLEPIPASEVQRRNTTSSTNMTKTETGQENKKSNKSKLSKVGGNTGKTKDPKFRPSQTQISSESKDASKGSSDQELGDAATAKQSAFTFEAPPDDNCAQGEVHTNLSTGDDTNPLADKGLQSRILEGPPKPRKIRTKSLLLPPKVPSAAEKPSAPTPNKPMNAVVPQASKEAITQGSPSKASSQMQSATTSAISVSQTQEPVTPVNVQKTQKEHRQDESIYVTPN